MFESVIKAKIQDYILKHALLHPNQHGFVAGHSTNTNLLQSLNDWTVNIRNKRSTRVTYIDFSRAFDSIVHKKLLAKLASYGIGGNLYNIIESFLENRAQQVIVDGVSSRVMNVISGVPQGSVLGPLLFIIYVNDLSEVISPEIASKLFADDVKLYTDVFVGDDIDQLQACIDSVVEWADRWQLRISLKKCSTIDFGHSSKIGAFCNNTIEGQNLSTGEKVTDLGVLFDSILVFTPHINQIIAKAKQRIFLMYRVFKSRVISILLLAYKTYILPLLSYCSSVWSPSTIGNIVALESVQKLFTRRIPGLKFMSYKDRLATLQLPSLELRRIRADLVLCFKILNGLIAGPPELYGLNLYKGATRGHDMRLMKAHDRVDARKHYFGCRITSPWNSLPSELVHSTSVSLFKRGLTQVDLSDYLLQN